ncbi:four-carbon acid sugar kinase family protein [Cryobacterium suzukii]|uniref:Four-carbon acid sugar kinase family protein n=1 Tax=Cryobacterium suzukii TaxID=1259198 RepID=A0A4V3ISW8_9MICO|nr:four-carbon acid sugar kinase family protein [Cryobacterium suzukii]TFD62561.1 four-carbon acid sugar kinase family protein [Cryobacterium suzukii]
MTRIGFLADDLTGAADVLAQAHAFGLDGTLILDASRDLPLGGDVVGIAGPTRSLAGEEFDYAVRSGITRLAAADLEVLLYKVCSTFDSSPTIGSIGRALDLIHEILPEHGPIPVVPAQPEFGRYTAFSQHFGVYQGEVYRLDRHPIMSRHPSTPMSEGDLRLVLAAQLSDGMPPPGLHLSAYAAGLFDAEWARLRSRADIPAFVVDAVDPAHLDSVAAVLLEQHVAPSVVVGSGGIMAALARMKSRQHRFAPSFTAASGPTLVASASASSTTAQQIEHALEGGWVDVPIPVEALTQGEPRGAWVECVERALRDGKDVVAHTLRGSDDPRFGRSSASTAQIGRTVGRLAGLMTRQGLTQDVVVCGGDTSSHALLAMNVTELRVHEQFVTAGPICSTDSASDLAGCRLLLKGGQVGPINTFQRFAGQR